MERNPIARVGPMAAFRDMGKSFSLGALGFILGAGIGLGLWWIVWNPMVDLGLFPPPTTREGDAVTIDPLSFFGYWIGLFVLPILGGVMGAKTALGRA